MQVDTSKLRVSTKRLVALLLAAGSLFQVPEVHDQLIAMAHGHPHIIGWIGAATGIAMLLHRPEVQDALGIKRTVEVKTEEVALK